MALGLTIVYGVIRIFNFAHGILAVMGGYCTWLFLTQIGLSLVPSIFISLFLMFFFGLALYHLTIFRLLKKPNWEFSTIIFSLGLGILLENIVLQTFGPRYKYFGKFFSGSLNFGYVRINWHDISIIIIVIISIIVLNLFFKKTWFGQSMRAVAQDMDGARIVGISVQKTFGFSFALATAVTAFSGILLASKYYITPDIGWSWMVKGFVIVVFGGLGSVSGAVYAAFLLGIAEAMTTLYLGTLGVWPVWAAMFLIILLIRPQGLSGGRTI